MVNIYLFVSITSSIYVIKHASSYIILYFFSVILFFLQVACRKRRGSGAEK